MKALFVNPNYFEFIYGKYAIRSAPERGPMPLGMALLSSILNKDGHFVELLDMNIQNIDIDDLLKKIDEFGPEMICFTMTTPLFSIINKYVAIIKETGFEGIIAVGGPHPTALPKEVLEKTEIDFAVVSIGDVLIKKLAEGSPNYKNIWRKVDGKAVEGEKEIDEIIIMDDLPFLSYNKKDIPKYNLSLLYTRNNPVAFLETSRGCFSKCIFCNKNISGYKFVAKSPVRVVDEMEYLLHIGYREIHIIDDGFTTDINRVCQICEEILRRGLKFTWYPRGGIRVDRVEQKMFDMMKAAGCFRVPFGAESGSQRVLDISCKGIKLEQVEKAVRLAKKAGLETECYFMIGLPTETENDVKKSYDLAKKMNPDYMKFAITVPLPGTKLFDDLKNKGRILTEEWDLYNFSLDPTNLYRHDVMSSKKIYALYNRYNRNYYLRPSYIIDKLIKGIKNNSMLFYARNGVKVLLNKK
jgi:anaerobic magnesium-protoporphyrin IX monomethyl ester cyclase